MVSIVVWLVLINVCLVCPAYVVSFQKDQSPVVSSQYTGYGSSVFKYNYNTAVIPRIDGAFGLLVRCQNQSNPNEPYSVTQSVLGYSKLVDEAKAEFSRIEADDVVFSPSEPYESYGTEDPRVVYREKNGEYYLLYTAVQQYPNNITARLALATTKTPKDKNSWKRYGPIIPTEKWSKSGALLIRDGFPGPHYLIFGDSTLYRGIQIATSLDLVNWNVTPGIFIPTRSNSFDSALVEAGPMPLPLSDGNYLFIYNSARGGYPSKKPGWDIQYNVGYVILDKNDPTRIIERSSEPLFSPELAWEKGDSPYLGLTPNVVFVEGWIALPGISNSFLVYYGAADSVIGTGILTVEIQ